MGAYLASIHRYPLKGGRGQSLTTAQYSARGILGDRHWLIVDAVGDALTQREQPKLAMIGYWDNGMGRSYLEIPGHSTRFELRLSRSIYRWDLVVRVHGQDCHVRTVATPGVNEALSELLGQAVQVVLISRCSRTVSETFNPTQLKHEIAGADAFPFLLTSASSLRALSDAIGTELPMDRFRPNLVIEGLDPWAEHRIKALGIGNQVFWAPKLCTRCVVTTVDQVEGEVTSKEPLASLARLGHRIRELVPAWETLGYSKKESSAVVFGANLLVDDFGGYLTVGDSVEVLEEW